jgi:hypothetical protein
MKTYRPQSDQSPRHANPTRQRSSTPEAATSRAAEFVDKRPEASAQRKLQTLMQQSPQGQRLAQLQAMIDHSPRQVALQRRQGDVEATANRTGLPDTLKAGIEHLSGMSMDDVRVHYNAAKPAQLNALAYTQGTDIHVGPGQERHLPHEAWHVVQQKQGRVKPMRQLQEGVLVNDHVGLEHEAEVMGAKALHTPRPDQVATAPAGSSNALHHASAGTDVIQRAVGFEIETNWRVFNYDQTLNNNGPMTALQKNTNFLPADGYRPAYLTNNLAKGTPIISGNHFELQVDELPTGGKDLEFVTTLPAFEETPEGRADLDQTLQDIEALAAALVNSPHWAIAPGDLGLGAVQTPTAVMKKNTTPGMNGSPQTTAAIRMDQIPTLFETIGTVTGEAPAPAKVAGRQTLSGVTNTGTQSDIEAGIMGDAPTMARQALANYKQTFANQFAFRNATREANQREANQLGSQQLIGLLSLLIMYLRIADQAQPTYAKQIAPFLARTNFSNNFHFLTPEEKRHFRARPGNFASLAMEAAGLPNTGNTPVLRHGIGSNPNANILDRVTRNAWLRGIPNGEDLLSQAGFDARFGANQGGAEFESLGRLGNRTEWVGRTDRYNNNRTRAPLFEMRRMKGSIPYLQWRPTLLSVFDFIRQINRKDLNPRL